MTRILSIAGLSGRSLLKVSCLSIAYLAMSAEATPANKKALAKFFGPHFPIALDSCATCHVRAEPEGAEKLEEFPHNAFGRALHGKDGKIAERLAEVIGQDSDGDGVSNLDEILLARSPGRAESETVSADAERLEELRQDFAVWNDRYAWKPFEPVVRPSPPALEGWGENEIDAFLSAGHRARGLVARPPAPPEVWLRRVTLDLTGLAPTREEIPAFLLEYERNPGAARAAVVDRLLESSHYGERWGRHWMDVWRYSDWSGYKDAVRISQPHIWRWRDWIIDSLNEDKPYDRMVLEMLAADELTPEDSNALRATGFLVRHHDVGSRDVWLDNVVSHTSQAFLGVTMGCVKCHDHMYDPFPQKEYYAMRAIFEGYHVRTDRIPGELDTKKAGLVRAFEKTLEPKTYLFDRGDERFPIKDEPVPPAVPAVLGGEFSIEPIELPGNAWQPWRRDFVKEMLLEKEKAAIEKAEAGLTMASESNDPEIVKKAELELAAAKLSRAALVAELATEDIEETKGKDSEEWSVAARKTLETQRQSALAEARWKLAAGQQNASAAEKGLVAAKEKEDKAKIASLTRQLSTAKAAIKTATESLAKAEKAAAGELTVAYVPRQPNYPNRSNGRRLAFARWLTNEQNPLTARVAMNHIWLRHFGEAIVPTVNEFGANGREPTHPALLDWLAAEFMESGWSMKAMHRKIVLSAAYEMSGTPDEDNLAKDPDNHFLWRMPSRRMEGEIVRDNLLWVSGRLDPAMGGPEIDQNSAMESKRRSIYFRHAHEKLVEFVQIFDGPKVAECYRRVESVQPHQALALHNSPVTDAAAGKLSVDLATETKGDMTRFVEEAFLAVLNRRPNSEEVSICRDFLRSAESGGETSNPEKARKRLVTVLLNHNDFVTIR